MCSMKRFNIIVTVVPYNKQSVNIESDQYDHIIFKHTPVIL